jgi:hypothetical protein
MTKVAVGALVILLLACVAVAGDWYHSIKNTETVSVTSDDQGDSTRTSGTFDIGPTYGANALKGRIIFWGPKVAYAGLGGDDTTFVWLYSMFAGEAALVDSALNEGSACTLDVRVLPAVGDSLLGTGLRIGWELYDSCGDTAVTREYDIKYEILLK